MILNFPYYISLNFTQKNLKSVDNRVSIRFSKNLRWLIKIFLILSVRKIGNENQFVF
mgnify:CR=1 FL=1|jgi:hypothetical protein